jgi:uncharacterized integral membrane protein
MQIFVLFSLLIAILAVIFALQNTAQITLSFLFWSYKGSLALVLLAALVAGALVSFFASLPALARNKWALRAQRKRMQAVETDLASHRTRLEAAERRLAEQEVQLTVLPANASSLKNTSEELGE